MAYQEFPRCLYLPDGTGRLVNTAEEKKAFLEKGWSESPPPKPPQPEAVSGAVEQPEAAQKEPVGPSQSAEQPEAAPKGQGGGIGASGCFSGAALG